MEQITAEYKLLALQYHPDKNEGDKEAERKFQQLKVRFSLLFITSKSEIENFENLYIRIFSIYRLDFKLKEFDR